MAVCRELTKLYEEVLRGTAAEVVEKLADPVRGEIVVVLAPATSTGGRLSGQGGAGRSAAPAVAGDVEQRALVALGELTAAGVGTKRAAAIVAGLTGLSTRHAYRLALQARASSALLE